MNSRVYTFLVSLIAGIFLCVLPGCALFGGGEEKLVHSDNYSLKAPSGWKAINPQEGQHAYRLPTGNVAVANSSCQRNANAPLVVLTRQLLLGVRQIHYEKQEARKAGMHEGLFSKVSGKIEKTPMHLLTFVLTHDGCVYDFSLLSKKQIQESEELGFSDWISSFQYGKN